MTNKAETVLAFMFETRDLRKGEQIKTIRNDLRKYAIGKGFNLPPKLIRGRGIDYTDELKAVLEGEEYFDCWDWGRKLIADSDRVRLYSLFRADGFDEFRKTERFQMIHNDIIDYSMKKNLYLECVRENPTKPPIVVSIPAFYMHSPEDFNSIDVNLSSNIIDYITKKRKEYGEPGPEGFNKRLFEEEARRRGLRCPKIYD
jgi:hypothetical protein